MGAGLLEDPLGLGDAPAVSRIVQVLSLSAALLLADAQIARAEVEPVRFAWVRGEGADRCSMAPHIEAEVQARLGRQPFSADASTSIEALITGNAEGYVARLYVRGRDGALQGTRELTSNARDCASIEAATVLAIAIAIDPDSAFGPPPLPQRDDVRAAAVPENPPKIATGKPSTSPETSGPAPFPPVVPALQAQKATAPPPSPVPAPLPAAEGTTSGLALRGGAGMGLLPGLAPGLELSGYLGLSRHAELTAASLWLPGARTSDGHFSFGLTGFSLGVCTSIARASLAEVAACGSLWGGAITAVVYDLTPTSPGDSFWAAAALTPRLRVPMTANLDLELGTEILVPITRHPFVVQGRPGEAFRQSAVAGFLFAGIGAHFP